MVLCRGLFEFDDIIHNSFGCMLGTLAGNEVLLLYKKIGELIVVFNERVRNS